MTLREIAGTQGGKVKCEELSRNLLFFIVTIMYVIIEKQSWKHFINYINIMCKQKHIKENLTQKSVPSYKTSNIGEGLGVSGKYGKIY